MSLRAWPIHRLANFVGQLALWKIATTKKNKKIYIYKKFFFINYDIKQIQRHPLHTSKKCSFYFLFFLKLPQRWRFAPKIYLLLFLNMFSCERTWAARDSPLSGLKTKNKKQTNCVTPSHFRVGASGLPKKKKKGCLEVFRLRRPKIKWFYFFSLYRLYRLSSYPIFFFFSNSN